MDIPNAKRAESLGTQNEALTCLRRTGELVDSVNRRLDTAANFHLDLKHEKVRPL